MGNGGTRKVSGVSSVGTCEYMGNASMAVHLLSTTFYYYPMVHSNGLRKTVGFFKHTQMAGRRGQHWPCGYLM